MMTQPVSPTDSAVRPRLCIFDFCGTLYESNTTLDFLAYLKPGAGRGYTSRYTAWLWVAAVGRRIGVLSPAAHMRIRIKSLKGLPIEFLRDAAGHFVKEFLVHRRREKEWALLNEKMRERRRVIIASYTLDLILDAFAAEYGLHEFFGSTLEFESGLCTGRYRRQLHERGKLASILALVDEATLSEAIFVTDSPESDHDLFDKVGYPVTV